MKFVNGEPVLQDFYVFSYGGCGSTVVSEWLSNWGRVYHLHDPSPPSSLTRGSTYAYESGAPDVRMDTQASLVTPEHSKVIYMYRDPVESMLSRPSWGHCCNIGGDWKKMKEWAETLPSNVSPDGLRKDYVDAWARHVASTGIKYMNYEEHFDAWTQTMTSYPIFFLNYKYLWDKKMQLLLASFLEIQQASVSIFPEKKETKKKLDAQTMRKLYEMYQPLNTKLSSFTEWFTSG